MVENQTFKKIPKPVVNKINYRHKVHKLPKRQVHKEVKKKVIINKDLIRKTPDHYK